MTLFLLSAAALIAATLWWLGRPLLSALASNNAPENQQSANRAALEEQLSEAQAEFEAGRIDEAAFKETEQELARRLLEEVKVESQSIAATGAPQSVLFAVLALFVVALSAGLYLDLGKPNLIAESAEPAAVETAGEFDPDAAKRRVLQLRQQLEINAQNAVAWAELARLERRLGQTADATRSYQHAAMLATNDSDKTELQLEMVETFALHAERNGTAIPPMALVVVNEVLGRYPEHPRALWYGSMLAEQAGQRNVAIERVETLLSLNPPEQIRAALTQQLAGWKAAQDEVKEPSSSVSSREIAVSVDIPPGTDVGNTNSATLFVYARAANGPKMPLAVRRYESPIFPLTLALNDSMAMVQGTQLGTYDELEVVARVSFTGDAIPQPGDWFGSKVISKGQDAVAIGIDTLVE